MVTKSDEGYYITSPRGIKHFVCNYEACHAFTISEFDIVDSINNNQAVRRAAILQALINNPDALVKVFSRLIKAKADLHAAVMDLKHNSACTTNNPAYTAILNKLGIAESFINRVANNRFN